MTKPDMPDMPNFPGMGAMSETFDFVKNLWGGMGIPGMNMPGMVMPTLSVEEINKKIADLKAVESWLALNMNMLRGTIQALEVQSATIGTLQTMGKSFNAHMAPSAGEGAAQKPAASSSDGVPGADGHEGKHAAPEPTSQDQSDAAGLTAPLANATAWWNALQGQFQQAVSNAMESEAAVSNGAKPKNGKNAAGAASPRKRKTGK